MKVYENNRCYADNGKHFVIAREIKREEHATLASYEVGEEVDFVLKDYIDSGYVKEVDIPGWCTDLKGFRVGYYHKNGTFLSCGNPQVFPTYKAALGQKKHYENLPWFDEEVVIIEDTYEGVPLSEPRIYNGKEVIDKEHYFGLDCCEIGDYFTSEMIQDFMDMLPPACYRSDCSQIGEPANHVNGKVTYATFKQIAEDVWEYCGDCFRGENRKAE